MQQAACSMKYVLAMPMFEVQLQDAYTSTSNHRRSMFSYFWQEDLIFPDFFFEFGILFHFTIPVVYDYVDLVCLNEGLYSTIRVRRLWQSFTVTCCFPLLNACQIWSFITYRTLPSIYYAGQLRHTLTLTPVKGAGLVRTFRLQQRRQQVVPCCSKAHALACAR